eukprot:CAMPEP_0197029458 /NCGR_PEP_ID=MMETSP1384-20130603/8901_1 /TAXON_ID=29189 /ORGANISM="Ammonia sp." /LENGTH=167 /DNA_ID=CAMNT_0042458623 /DNA_START=52 /DNA_END=555 /DNA_ORIENTATION=-
MSAVFLRHFIKKATTIPRSRAVKPLQQVCGREYDEKVVEHFNNPRNVGTMDTNDENVGTGLVGAPACGDVMRFQFKVDENGKIVDSCFKTFGCGSAIASSSFATEKIVGMHIDDAAKLTNKDIAKELNLPPVKLHCSMLAEDGIKAAIKDLEQKRAAKQTEQQQPTK